MRDEGVRRGCKVAGAGLYAGAFFAQHQICGQASGSIPGRLPELAVAVQIDTILKWLETRVKYDSQRLILQFNRTLMEQP